MTAATEYAAPVPVVLEHRPWWRGRLVWTSAIVGAMVVCYFALKSQYPWPSWLEWGSIRHGTDGAPGYLDRFQTWLLDNRNTAHPNVIFRAFNGLATFLDNLVTWLYDALTKGTWVGTTVAATLVVLRFGGLRAGAIMFGAFASFAALGLWDESMQTLALMLAAVSLSLAVGMPLGVLAGRSDRFNRGITPVLDGMQIIPAFAYLMPVVILFSVGPGAAVVTTMIYAVPPAVRITALGIRGVPANTVEAAHALGSTVLRCSARCSYRSPAECCSCPSTRRSCSPSRWW